MLVRKSHRLYSYRLGRQADPVRPGPIRVRLDSLTYVINTFLPAPRWCKQSSRSAFNEDVSCSSLSIAAREVRSDANLDESGTFLDQQELLHGPIEPGRASVEV